MYSNMKNSIFRLFICSLCLIHAKAWDNDDLEVFDVVEEVNQNFYELLGIQQNASTSEIRSSYKVLALKLHPDKNSAADAEIQFRNLVSVYEVLKDPGKREKYNEVLKNGLPNWRSAVYYYRHVRKMGLVEMSIILFIIVTIGQYMVYWASYAEKRFTAEQILASKRKKPQRKAGKGNTIDVDEIIAEIPSPSVKDLLPCQIVRLIVFTVCFMPRVPGELIGLYKQRRERILEERRREEEERLERIREEEEIAKEKENKALRRRRTGFVPAERNYDEPSCYLDPVDEPGSVAPVKPPAPVSGGLWTDDDLAELVRLVKKHPPGTSGRWERIAETMGRGVAEVTHMAAKLKDNCYRLPGSEQSEAEIPGLEISKKVKTKGGKVPLVSNNAFVETSWSQTQQKALETALAKYPKGGGTDRWDKIAKCVPDKTKEECMLRYKYLAELLKKQKSESLESQPTEGNEPPLQQPIKNDQLDKVEIDKSNEDKNGSIKNKDDI